MKQQFSIASLPKHLEELKSFLQEIPFEILSLNEMRSDETIQNTIVQIPGYEMIKNLFKHGRIIQYYNF